VVDTVERVLEDSLIAWQDGSDLLETLPSLNPDHESVRLAVAKLRSVYEGAVARRQVGSVPLRSSRDAIESAARTLRAVRERHKDEMTRGEAGSAARHIERTIAQAEDLLRAMPPYSAEYDRISAALVELRQIEAMIGTDSDRRHEGMIRRATVQAQLAIAQASATRRTA
jgi:hypothetical protein